MSRPSGRASSGRRPPRRRPSGPWRLALGAVRALARTRPSRWLALVLVPAAALLAWPDPDRSARLRRQADERAARQEALAAAQPSPPVVDGVTQLNFHWLEFPAADAASRPGDGPGQRSYGAGVPERIRRLDGSRIRIRGFMLPTREEADGVREFMVLASRMSCCFGQTPGVCDFLAARMRDKPAAPSMDEPLGFEGVLHVGDVYVNGYWSALYTLDCTGVAP